MSDNERRFTPGRVEARAGDRRTIGGYAAKFNRTSQNLGGFVEVIAPGAFSRARGNGWPDVMARYNHDDNMLLGTTGAGTLRLNVDDTGLEYEVDMPGSRGDVFELVQRGDVARSSFAFRVIGVEGEEWGLSEQGFPQRTLLSVDLVDVAPVNTPAYLDTSTGLRHLAERAGAPLEEVRRLAEQNDLRRLLVRSDVDGGAPKRTLGASAVATLLGKRDPYAS